jgi:hypothetical protein
VLHWAQALCRTTDWASTFVVSATLDPQLVQNFNPGLVELPQFWQNALSVFPYTISVPQPLQNSLSGTKSPQAEHTTVFDGTACCLLLVKSSDILPELTKSNVDIL